MCEPRHPMENRDHVCGVYHVHAHDHDVEIREHARAHAIQLDGLTHLLSSTMQMPRIWHHQLQ